MEGTDAGVADGAGDGAVKRDDAWVDAEAVRDEPEHVGGVAEGAGHGGVECFEGGDGVGPRGGVADVSEGLEGAGVFEKVARLGVAGLGCECESNMRDSTRHTTHAPGHFAVELANAAALEGLGYPHDVAVRDGLEEVADGSNAGRPSANDDGIWGFSRWYRWCRGWQCCCSVIEL